MPDELEREKSVIVQEIGAAQDTPDDVVFEHLNELCYPDQPMGRSLLGTAKTLKRFNRDMLRGYLSTHYRGPDMVVAAAGAVDHKRVVEEVDAALCQFRRRRRRRSRSRRCSARAARASCIATSSRRI